MITGNEKLFSAFEPASKQSWKETAITDLKGADFDKKLVWKTDEDIAVQPFYTAEDWQDVSIIPHKSSSAKRSWTNYVEVDVKDLLEANKFMLRMMEFDVTGFLLNILETETIHFSVLLKGIDPEKTEISFKLQSPSPTLLHQYFSFVTAQGHQLVNIHGFVQADVLEAWSTKATGPDFKNLAAQLKITAQAKNFKGLMLSSHAFVNAGAGIVQEAAFLLNKLTDTIESLEKEGLEQEQIISQLALHLAVGGDYFFEIAKLRAIKKLLTAILSCYSTALPDVPVLSSNAAWSKSLYDPTVNMLRNTTEAMSAILGGCNAILINPHDSTYKTPDEFTHRIALNISNLLKEESYFDKVTDPAAGSYYIETITAQLAEKMLQLFNETEAAGGYVESFKNGWIQQKIAALKDKKEAEIASRRKVYVGMNKYVNAQENIAAKPVVEMRGNANDFPLLHAQRATRKFEQLRQQTQQQFVLTGKIPRVYLACYGHPAMRTARAAFAEEFFGTAGFSIGAATVFETVQMAAEAAAKGDADIVVICSSDADYETGAITFAEIFKGFTKDKKLLLAGYPSEMIENLKLAGVDDFIHQKTNVVEFIAALQQKLFAVK